MTIVLPRFVRRNFINRRRKQNRLVGYVQFTDRQFSPKKGRFFGAIPAVSAGNSPRGARNFRLVIARGPRLFMMVA